MTLHELNRHDIAAMLVVAAIIFAFGCICQAAFHAYRVKRSRGTRADLSGLKRPSLAILRR